ncbi:MAG: hypothetical protein MI784_17735 [Cytophagales bacterium]|nr:hypothetical protein [Cytophagales bacterium]
MQNLKEIQSVVAEKLSRGKTGSLGSALDLLPLMEKDERWTLQVILQLSSPNAMVALRASNCLNRLGMSIPNLLKSHKKAILREFQTLVDNSGNLPIDMPTILAKLDYTPSELKIIFENILRFYDGNSHTFSKANCLQALTDLSVKYNYEKEQIVSILRHEEQYASKASIKARCRRLLIALL